MATPNSLTTEEKPHSKHLGYLIWQTGEGFQVGEPFLNHQQKLRFRRTTPFASHAEARAYIAAHCMDWMRLQDAAA